MPAAAPGAGAARGGAGRSVVGDFCAAMVLDTSADGACHDVSSPEFALAPVVADPVVLLVGRGFSTGAVTALADRLPSW